jgi:branched-subunit amino acid ABC-type transport system permease component
VNTIVLPSLVTGCQFALVALGVNVLARVTGIVNFAFGNVIAFAPLVVLIGIQKWGLSLSVSLVLSGLLVVVALALIQERITIRPFLGSGTALPWILSTLAASLILGQIAETPFKGESLPFPYNFGQGQLKIGPLQTTWVDVTLVCTSIAVYIGVLLFSSRTSVGRMLTAVSQDPMGASVVGISVGRASQIAALMSALIAFAIGITTAPIVEVSSGASTLSVLFTGFVAATIGGIGSLTGSLPGGLIAGFLIQIISVYLGPVWINTFLFLGLIVILAIRPNGLFGTTSVRVV